MKRWLILPALLLLALLGLTAVLLFNLAGFSSRQPQRESLAVPPQSQQTAEAALQRLSQAVALPTVSWQNPAVSSNQAFDKLHALFAKGYPQIYRRLKPERLGNSLLIHWPGSEPRLAPLLLAAHLDVVPAEQPASWKHPPFSGLRKDGYIWGRGSLDDKNSALAILEAVEARLKTGYKPRRGLYLAFGEDEEIGGARGAQRIAALLARRKVKLSGVLDEGLVIVPGSLIGMQPPIALIGIAEKGYLTVELGVKQAGGHSSMPPAETAVDILAKALLRLRAQPMPARFAGPAGEMLSWLGPEMSGFKRLALANRWLFEPVLLNQFAGKPSSNALIRTTVAPTMLSASPKENVLAGEAKGLVNLRVLPGDGPESVLAHFRKAINDDRVGLRIISDPAKGKASKVSRSDSPLFGQLAGSLRAVHPKALVAPSLVLAATDSRHYEPIADDIYRFQPVYLDEKDLERLHGRNERIGEQAYLKMIAFYSQLIGKQ